MVRDDGLPQLAERARVGDEQHRPARERSRGGGGRCSPRATGNEQDCHRRDDRKGEQLDGHSSSSKHAHGRPPPRATAGVEGDCDGAEREGNRSRVRLDPRGLHGPGRCDGEERGGAERSPYARELPADRVGGDQPKERDEHECDTNPLDAVARQQRQAPGAARRSRAAATRRRPSPAPGRDAGRRAMRGTRPRRSSRPPRRRGCTRTPRPRAARRARRRGHSRAHGTVTVTGFERRKTSPISGSSTQFAAAPTLYVHVPGPGPVGRCGDVGSYAAPGSRARNDRHRQWLRSSCGPKPLSSCRAGRRHWPRWRAAHPNRARPDRRAKSLEVRSHRPVWQSLVPAAPGWDLRSDVLRPPPLSGRARAPRWPRSPSVDRCSGPARAQCVARTRFRTSESAAAPRRRGARTREGRAVRI